MNKIVLKEGEKYTWPESCKNLACNSKLMQGMVDRLQMIISQKNSLNSQGYYGDQLYGEGRPQVPLRMLDHENAPENLKTTNVL